MQNAKKKTIFFSKIIQFINIKWQKSWTLSIKIKFSIKILSRF